MNVHLIRLNPYDPNLGLLVPIVGKRIMEFAKEHNSELDPVAVTKAIMLPVWSQDPFTAVLAMVNPEGTVVGHAVASINTDGMNHWITVSQTQADGAVGDAVKRSIEYIEGWVETDINPLLHAAGKPPIAEMVMVTGKNEKAWERDFGFKLKRRVLIRKLGKGEEGPTEGSG